MKTSAKDKSVPKKAAAKKNPAELILWKAPGKSPEAMLARHAISPEFSSVSTVKAFAANQWGADNMHLTHLAAELTIQADAAQRGDLSRGEGMLIVQAHTLNVIFNNLAQRAALNLGEYPDAAERYLRLAMKAQSQCRSTIETLAEIKNPRPIAFVKQANIAHGHQQVNNGSSRGENETQQNKLSEVDNELSPNPGTPTLESRTNPPLETVGKIDRPKVKIRKS